ncbi:actin family [Leucosporidium creatinivorum]|uniref:Actin family n=1 Tax=Leucosporidium creatinivorum TaxID=106004 RepID=A0A1Y2FFY8_9BASI|nr:actin family [Leucosporidium creatinivorum]
MVPPVQYGGDEVSAIVLDIGSHTTRAGYAGEDSPKTVFPTTFSTVPGSPPTYTHGNSLHLYRPNSIHSNLLSDGLVTDWPALSRTLDHAFRDRMRLPDLSEFPLLVTEASWNTKENREKMCEVAFEEWKTPAYYTVDKSVMSSFASGKGSALVIDVGEEMTSVVPIYDGFVLRKAIQKQPVGGNLLSSVLLSQLKNSTPPIPVTPHYLVKTKEAVPVGAPAKATLRDERKFNPEDPNCPTTLSYHRSQEMRVMHEFKESTCEVLSGGWDDATAASTPTRPFEFPDGYNALFGLERLTVPEILFNPQRFLPQEFTQLPLPASTSTIPSHPYSNLQPITRLFSNSLVQIDPDLHSTFFNNIVVTGGTSLTQGFVDRLQTELAGLSGGMKTKIHAASSPAERIHSSWLGGSILASLGTFHQLWIGKDEYDEVGASIVTRRGGK